MIDALKPKIFMKTEWIDIPRLVSTAKGRCDIAAQRSGVTASDEYLVLLIGQTASKMLPTFNILYFVKKQYWFSFAH